MSHVTSVFVKYHPLCTSWVVMLSNPSNHSLTALFSFSFSLVLCHQPDHGLFALFGMLFSEGEELLGTEGARYMKMDDMKDHDDDFLSPKKSMEYERGLGTA